MHLETLRVYRDVVRLRSFSRGAELNFVTAAQKTDVRTALINARGFGGFNAALVLRRLDGTD